MDSATVGGILRTILAALGGILVTKGYTDEATVQTVVGGVITVGTAIWSVIQKQNAASDLKAAVAAPAGSTGK